MSGYKREYTERYTPSSEDCRNASCDCGRTTCVNCGKDPSRKPEPKPQPKQDPLPVVLGFLGLALVLILMTILIVAYWMLGPSLPGSDGQRGDPAELVNVTPIDYEPACELDDNDCYRRVWRRALGGDLESITDLRLFHSARVNASGAEADLIEAYIWAALGYCTLDGRDLEQLSNRTAVCTADLEVIDDSGQFDRRVYYEGPGCYARSLRDPYQLHGQARAAWEQILPQMSTRQVERAHALMIERLSALGPTGLILIGDMYQKGCALGRDMATAGAYYIVASGGNGAAPIANRGDDDSSGSIAQRIAEQRWQSIYSLLTVDEVARAQSQAISLRARLGAVVNNDPLREARYRADEITIFDIQKALADLGHLQGQVDGDLGPNTRAAIASFQSCEGLPDNGVLNDLLRVRIIETAVRGGARPGSTTIPRCHSGKESKYATYTLGMMYLSGVGVQPDLNRAESLLREALTSNNPSEDQRYKISGRANLGLALLTYKYELPDAASPAERERLLAETCQYFIQSDAEPGEALSYLREDIAQMRAAVDPYLSGGDCAPR